MKIREPGWIHERLALIGLPSAALYLLRGRELCLLGAGVAWEAERVEEHLDQLGIDRYLLRYLVISHAHHDHCGLAPYLTRKYPRLQTVASAYGSQLLTKEKVVGLMNDLNARTLAQMQRPNSHAGVPLAFEPITVSRSVSDGEFLDLGDGVTLQFIETPGHSRCSLSVYVPGLRALFPGDAIPYPNPGGKDLTVTANHDYGDYLRSLRKLVALPVEIVGYEHGGALVGEEAEGIVARGMSAALEHRERIRRRYAELQDREVLVQEIAGKYLELELFRLLSPEVMQSIIRRMVESALDSP